MSTDGQRMEAEQRYIAGEETLAKLAAETGIPLTNLKRWCKQYGWVKKREKFQKRALRKAAVHAADKKARELAKLFEASEDMEAALIAAAKALRQDMQDCAEDFPTRFATGEFRAKNVEHIAKALNKQAETRMLISGVMAAADREKIELMKRKQDAEEQKARQEAEGGGLVIRLEEAVDEQEEPVIE